MNINDQFYQYKHHIKNKNLKFYQFYHINIKIIIIFKFIIIFYIINSIILIYLQIQNHQK